MTDIVPTTWHDLASARDQWQDAPDNDESLQTLLDVAQRQVTAFAPKLVADDGTLQLAIEDPVTGVLGPVTDETVPSDYRLAQLMQARNTWNANMVDPANGAMGDGSFVIRPFPLDWMVKQVIRPKKILPWVG